MFLAITHFAYPCKLLIQFKKGDIKTGTKQTYSNANAIGDIDIKPGNVYLITYFDENNPTDIFEVTSYDTKTLKLKNVEGDMWMRFQKYLNNGDYEEAEQERRDRLGLLDELMEDAEKLPPLENNTTEYIVLGAVVVFIVAFAIGFVVKKKRKQGGAL